MAIQSSLPSEQKYTGWLTGLKTIYREEGVSGLYRNPIFTFCYHFIVSAMKLIPQIFLLRYTENLSVSPKTASLVYFCGQQLLIIGQLLVRLPLETIRRRLHVQSRIPVIIPLGYRSFLPRVKLHPALYTGPFNCFKRILMEEGIRALYRGWGLHLLSNTLKLLINLITEFQMDDQDDDNDDNVVEAF